MKILTIVAAILLVPGFVLAQDKVPAEPVGPISNPDGLETSPIRGLKSRGPIPPPGPQPGPQPRPDIQSLDGSGNNLGQLEMGAAHQQLLRRSRVRYPDGVAALAGANRPNPRTISNLVHAQSASIPNDLGFSDMLWQWGQFLDHDIDLTDGVDPAEIAAIPIPAGDEYFDPDGTGTQLMSFNRSVFDPESGTGRSNPRQQINEITAWIDASNVYGSDEERSRALRRMDGSGQLRTSRGNLLPFNDQGLPNAGGTGDNLFLAGDVRANEQVGLTAMHTLFVREHNRIARRLANAEPHLDGEQIYQRARREVIAIMQVITYNEFLPALLGPDALSPYAGYDSDVEGGILNEFSTGAYRLGHTMLSPFLLRLDANGAESESGHLSLADAFFRPDRLIREGGIEPVLRGLAAQECQAIDVYLVDEVRNFLFGLPGQGGFDLATLNIQRGRDHGLGSYNDARRAFGLRPVRRFDQISSKPEVRERLQQAYGSPADMDLWSAGLAEDPVENAIVGETFHAILVAQFEALRDGDRFWYQHILPAPEARRIARTRLADVIRRNTRIGSELQDNAFVIPTVQ